MSIDGTLQAVTNLPISVAIREGSNLFPFIESCHVLTIVCVVGTIAVIDLRLVGLPAHTVSIRQLTRQLLPITWGAFAVAGICGALLFASNATTYYYNTAFRIKMSLMVLAGLNMLVFHLFTQKSMHEWDVQPMPPPVARLAGFLSLFLWAGVVFFGRRVGFTLR